MSRLSALLVAVFVFSLSLVGVSSPASANTNYIMQAINDAPNIATPSGHVATFRSPDGTGNAIIPTSDGTQFIKIIHQSTAPEHFTFPVDVPVGGRIALVKNGPDDTNGSGQSALVLNAANDVVGLVDMPWAIDANGHAVTTYYTTDGTTLIQHIVHRHERTSYPVIADPYFKWYGLGVVVTFSYDEMQLIAAGGLYAATGLVSVSIPTGVGVMPAGAISAAMMPVVSGAAWGVATHSCYWLWMPYPGVLDKPEHGYYDC